MDDLLTLLEQWHEEDQYQQIIDRLETLSNTQPLDYTLTCQLARAYNNLADLNKPEGRGQLEQAEALLRSVAEEGKDDPLWHYRLGYSLYYLDREEEALACFERTLELDPENEGAKHFIPKCRKYSFLSLLEKWNQEDEYQKIIDCLETLSNTQTLDYTLTCQLARAYNNIAEVGDEERLGRAEALLRSVAEEGKDDPLWHYRLGYSLYYLNREDEALACFERVLELDPEDEDAKEFIQNCKKYIAAKECHPEMYTQEQWDAVEAHLERYFGPCDNVFHEIVSPDIHVDIYIMNPTPARNYYVLSTFGMGAHRMNVPEELADRKLERAEIIVTLPPDWQVENNDERWYWPLRWLKILARLPIQEDGWLGWGHTISNPDDAPFADNTKLCGLMLAGLQGFDEDAVCCPLPDGEEVNFYQMIPLTFEEMQFKIYHTAGDLLMRFPPQQLEVVDIHRPSVCGELEKKRFAIPRTELKQLYGGEGPQGCIATDRIVVDGAPVGYCYRVEPDAGDEAWDSGWRFTAGDEGSGYLDDPDKSGVYALNTICNYDPDIIPLLDSEPGTAWSRGEDGVFRPELYEED